MTLHTGSQGHYHWLTSEDHDLADLMRNCPETVLGKYLAVTAIDSAPLEVTEEDKVAGWETRKNIAYSPRIKSVAELPHENRHGRCEGFDEWYVFDRPIDLGQRFTGNIFEAGVEPDRVESFVNYYGFALHDATMQSITDLFWKQMEWMQPESYIADGGTCLTFVSCDQDMFSAVHKALMSSPVRG